MSERFTWGEAREEEEKLEGGGEIRRGRIEKWRTWQGIVVVQVTSWNHGLAARHVQ